MRFKPLRRSVTIRGILSGWVMSVAVVTYFARRVGIELRDIALLLGFVLIVQIVVFACSILIEWFVDDGEKEAQAWDREIENSRLVIRDEEERQ